jgi:hypothetical protein
VSCMASVMGVPCVGGVAVHPTILRERLGFQNMVWRLPSKLGLQVGSRYSIIGLAETITVVSMAAKMADVVSLNEENIAIRSPNPLGDNENENRVTDPSDRRPMRRANSLRHRARPLPPDHDLHGRPKSDHIISPVDYGPDNRRASTSSAFFCSKYWILTGLRLFIHPGRRMVMFLRILYKEQCDAFFNMNPHPSAY